jgi:hypothetical protein
MFIERVIVSLPAATQDLDVSLFLSTTISPLAIALPS